MSKNGGDEERSITMNKAEFEKLMEEEQEKGTQVAGTTTNKREIMKMSLCIRKAMIIIGAVREQAAEDKDMDMVTDCIFADEGLELVFDKIVDPLMSQIERLEKARHQKETAEDPAEDE